MIIAVIYTIGYIIAYMLCRYNHKHSNTLDNENYVYTKGSRALYLILSLMSWFMVFIAILYIIFVVLPDKMKDETEAKW